MTKGIGAAAAAVAAVALAAAPAAADTWSFELDHDWMQTAEIETADIETADAAAADRSVWEIAPTAGPGPARAIWRPEPTAFERSVGLGDPDRGRSAHRWN